MAGRRSGNTVVLTIFMAIGNAVLLVASFWLWQHWQQAQQRASAAITDRDKSRDAHRQIAADLDAIRKKVNRQADLTNDELLRKIDDELHEFGTGSPDETYSEIVRRLSAMGESHRIEINQLTADKRRLEEDYDVMRAARQKAVEVAEADSQEARTELLKQQAEIDRALAAKDSEIARILDRANTLASRMETEKRDKERIREELLGQVNKLRRILVEARAPHTPDALAKQKADGRVIKASAATRTAWLNIGSKDGVKEQLTFSVQPAGHTGNPFARPKAKLEVIRVTGPDMCEARIIEAILTNPVIEGDEIYNPAWNPGKVMRFALGGLLDIDGDGADDRNKVRQLITRAGAQIDAEVMPDGSSHGAVTVETNYFIRGGHPDPEKSGVIGMKVLSTMAEMEQAALDYGAVIIDLAKFLDLIGYTHVQRVESSASR